MKTKVCFRCGEVKPTKEFYKDSRAVDKLAGHCKVCHWMRKENPEYLRSPSVVQLQGTKICNTCNKVTNLDNFYKKNSTKDNLEHKCKDCYNKHKKTRLRDNLTAHKARMAQVKFSYALSEDDLQGLLWRQQGCCAICGVDFGSKLRTNKGRQYAIDHNHSTGKVRGLLCMACNMYLGQMEKQNSGHPNILEYLKRGQATI